MGTKEVCLQVRRKIPPLGEHTAAARIRTASGLAGWASLPVSCLDPEKKSLLKKDKAPPPKKKMLTVQVLVAPTNNSNA